MLRPRFGRGRRLELPRRRHHLTRPASALAAFRLTIAWRAGENTGAGPRGGDGLHLHHRLHRRAGDRDHRPHPPRTHQGVHRRKHGARGALVRGARGDLRRHPVLLRAHPGLALGPGRAPARHPDLAVRPRNRLHHHGARALHRLALRGPPHCGRDGREHHDGQRLRRRRVRTREAGPELRTHRGRVRPRLHLSVPRSGGSWAGSTFASPSSPRRASPS